MTAFVLWMLLWPMGCNLCRSYRIKVGGKTYSDEITGASVLLELAVWVVVGIIVFQNRGAA